MPRRPRPCAALLADGFRLPNSKLGQAAPPLQGRSPSLTVRSGRLSSPAPLRMRETGGGKEGGALPQFPPPAPPSASSDAPAACNSALDLLQSRSRRRLLQAAAAGVATGLFAEKGFPQLLRPPPASAADLLPAPARGMPYDLGLDKFNIAPGQKIVLPDPEVEKSPSDTRSYRALTLANGLRVLLASDPRADQSAAALDVHVGHFSDPPDLPGLAHFCEHMLFLGNAKYPGEGELDAYLGQHGGSSNAYTAEEDTCYFFSVNQDAFEGALDRFSQFFVSPLFTATATDRELNAIESEHSKNLQQDSWRVDQLQKLRANPKHPFSKFGTGNRYTLKERPQENGVDLREQLLEYYKNHYSANMMTLAVVGREPLDQLEEWVTKMFSGVPNNDVPPPERSWAGKVAPFTNGNEVLSVVPIKDDRSFTISWVLPFTSKEDRKMKLETKPDAIAGSLLGHEGKGSLLSYLKGLGLVTGLGASLSEQTSDFQVMSVGVELTPAGLEQSDTVIEAIFSYINMVNTERIPPYIIKEAQSLSDVSWQFRDNAEAGDIAPALASNMHDYSPRLYLSGPSRLRDIDPEAVRAFFAKLTPQNAFVTQVSQTFEGKAKKAEKWYKTKYASESQGAYLSKWRDVQRLVNLTYPAPNPFIPSDFSLKASATEDLNVYPEGPILIDEEPKWRVHHKQDRRYGKPKAYAYFNLKQPNSIFGTSTSPRTSALAKLFKASLGDALTEYTYDAAIAGLGCSLDFTPKAARLTFSGYNDKLPAFVDSIASAIVSHRPDDEEKLARYKDQLRRELSTFYRQQPYQHAAFFTQLYTQTPAFLPDAVLKEIDAVTLEDIRQFASTLWDKCFGEVLVQGNVLEEEARGMVSALERSLNFTELKKADQGRADIYLVPLSPKSIGNVIRIKEPNEADRNSAVMVQVQHADQTLKQQMAMEVLASIVEQPFYSDLRTNQQLGYIVSSGIKLQNDVRSLVFTVQSNFADATYLTDKVFAFIKDFEKTLKGMSDKEVEGYIGGLVEIKSQKITRLSDETIRNWDEIVEGKYQVDGKKVCRVNYSVPPA